MNSKRVCPRSALLAAGFTALLLSGCYRSTQRYPRPMVAVADPLPPGAVEAYPAGPEEVLVVRIADPVHVRRPGEVSSFPLYFFRKQARMNAGSWVFSGAGGRAEVLFPGNSTVTLHGLGAGVVGSASRGEPLFFFKEINRASITLQADEQVRLLGGAVLAGAGGPFVVERLHPDILRVRNRTEATGRVAYLDEVFLLDPGDVIDLPLLDSGADPIEADMSFQTIGTGGSAIQVRGQVELVEDPSGVRLRALGEHEIRANGLRLRLDVGEEVLFTDLGGGKVEASRNADARPEDSQGGQQ